MSAWAGRQCGSQFATSAGTSGYRKVGTRPIAPQRNAAQCCGTRAASTVERGQRESRRDAAAGRRQAKTDDVPNMIIFAYQETIQFNELFELQRPKN